MSAAAFAGLLRGVVLFTMLGTTIGKYRIIERLGRGGMGTVYKAVDETLDRAVAIKVLNPDLADADLLKRFRAEAITLARLNHSGIATIYELHQHGDDLLMVMEFVRGETLHDLCARLGPLAPPQVVHICAQVLHALSYAHRAGVVHRDLKPANLMVTDAGLVKVMDFGIARVLGGEHLTHGGYMMGTPAYMSPEQVLGGEIDGRADLYAVGVIFYRLLTGELPFRADTAISMAQKQIADAPTPVGHFRPDLPSWCADVIDRALAKSPDRRFQTAEEFRATLTSAVRAESISEMPTQLTPGPPGLPRPAELEEAADTLLLGERTPRSGAIRSGVLDMPATKRIAASARSVDANATPLRTSPERTTTTVVLGRTHLAALAAVLVLLTIGIGVLALVALRPDTSGASERVSTESPQQATSPATAIQPPSAAPDAAPAPAPPANSSASPAVERSVATAGSAPVTAATTAGPAGAVPAADSTARGRGAARGESSPAKPDAASLPVVKLPNVRVLMTDAGKARERQGQLQIAGDQLVVMDRDGGTPIAALPFNAVVSAFYSRSRQPKWRDEGGKEVESKVDLGRLGFLRADRNWLILTTRSEPFVLRFEDDGLQPALATIQERTGVKIQR